MGEHHENGRVARSSKASPAAFAAGTSAGWAAPSKRERRAYATPHSSIETPMMDQMTIAARRLFAAMSSCPS
jgi:hypothetical protein